MGLAEKQKFVLFVLGKLCETANMRLKEKMLQVSISKSAFIEIVRRGGLTEKGERALYKNLEDLEKSKHISYQNRVLNLTANGSKEYGKISRQLSPYLNIIEVIDSENLVKLTTKTKTTLFFN